MPKLTKIQKDKIEEYSEFKQNPVLALYRALQDFRKKARLEIESIRKQAERGFSGEFERLREYVSSEVEKAVQGHILGKF